MLYDSTCVRLTEQANSKRLEEESKLPEVEERRG
jgi:hypothetical protein